MTGGNEPDDQRGSEHDEQRDDPATPAKTDNERARPIGEGQRENCSSQIPHDPAASRALFSGGAHKV